MDISEKIYWVNTRKVPLVCLAILRVRHKSNDESWLRVIIATMWLNNRLEKSRLREETCTQRQRPGEGEFSKAEMGFE